MQLTLGRPDLAVYLPHLQDIASAQKEHEDHDSGDGPSQARCKDEKKDERGKEPDSVTEDGRDRFSHRVAGSLHIIHHSVYKISRMEGLLAVPSAVHYAGKQSVTKTVLQKYVTLYCKGLFQCRKQDLQHKGSHKPAYVHMKRLSVAGGGDVYELLRT